MDKNQNLYSKYKYIWEQLDNTMDSLFSYIQSYPFISMDSYGNITVANTKDKDTCPVFCCHLDTVHQKEPELELVKEDLLMSMGGGGVGGDDKCGIVACLELLEKIPCKCLFFRDEERGCVGSKEFDAKTLKDNAFCIEIDRRGDNDLVFSASHGQMCSEEFQERVKKAFPHGVAAQGSLTDVCVIGDDVDINMMNLSAGYYRPHTDKEYVVLSELQRNIHCLIVLAKDIMENPLQNKTYKRSKYNVTKTYASDWANKSYGRTSALFPGVQTEEDVIENPGADDYEALQYGQGKKWWK